jgi:hypothetical protein
VVKFYADAHRRVRNDEDFKITHTPEGLAFRSADLAAALSALAGLLTLVLLIWRLTVGLGS